jgi:general secretion pathway protein G
MSAAMSEIQNLRTALDSFQVDNGFYPTNVSGLQDLIRRPIGATNWHGPYVGDIPKDPWGRDYVYECPGKHAAQGYPYDLLSIGPPGASNPIANWMYGLKPL